MNELCGKPTSSGKPCNMPKGHAGNFHRYREYKKPVEWSIKAAKSYRVIEQGNGRMELGYAMTRALKKHKNIVIYVGQDQVD